ncbi:MAG: prolyl oligopeptidase family serine peptidase [Candidatus Hodarchaeota archaeon]
MNLSSQKKFERYLAIETAGGAAWHPESTEIIFVYDSPGQFQIFSVPIKKHHILWPTRLTYETNRCTDPRWLSDGTIIFTSDRGGDENFQIGLIDTDGELLWLTTDLNAKHLITNVTETSVYYSANIKDKSVFAIYRHKIPLKSNRPELIYQPVYGIFKTKIASQDEKRLILQQYTANNHQELFVFDIETKKLRSLTGLMTKDANARWDAHRWIDEEYMLVTSDHKSEFLRFVLLNLNGEMREIIESEEGLRYDVERVTWTERSPFTYFAYNKEGYSKLSRVIFTNEGCTNFEFIQLPQEAVIIAGDTRSFTRGMTVSPDGKMLAITLSSPNSPSNVWIFEVDTKEYWKATGAGTAGLNPTSFSDTTLEEFHSFDKLRVPYFRYIPRGQKPKKGWPAIIMIHGGPEAQVRPAFSPFIQFCLSSGFAVITPNIRGSTGYSKTYLDLDNVEKRLDSIQDIKYLATHLNKKDKEIDSNRLTVFGGSYGGFAVLSAMTEHPKLWKAGVDLFGIANFITFLKNTASWRRKVREAEYGSLEHDMETLKRISPIHKIDQIIAPLFIIAGDNDERVPLSESIQMYEKLKEKGLPVKLLRFADEGHGITKLKNRIQAYSEVINWLKEHV